MLSCCNDCYGLVLQMVNYCCAPLCNGYWGFHFPKDNGLKNKWRVAVKKGVHEVKTSQHPRKCIDHNYSHSENSNFIYNIYFAGERKRLKKGIVPSIFLEGIMKRRAKKFSVCTPSSSATVPVPDIQQEIEVSTETVDDETLTARTCILLTNSDGTFSAHKFKENPTAIKYYTGFDDYGYFMKFLTVLGPVAAHLNRNYKLVPCA
ncbi:hypothetical protein MAR_026471 [Mya arenaria]|uniref:THAP-type domain-containing protein n=1 Tax=Mya arenaria TaxID=6604 RepID=A0ABY7EUB4_MYAAR|nr:hypothetical protein MAR_026471 [Mya arenaria]